MSVFRRKLLIIESSEIAGVLALTALAVIKQSRGAPQWVFIETAFLLFLGYQRGK